MNSSNPDEVLAALGDKVCDALGVAVGHGRRHLHEYRQVLPDTALAHSERGLANWIHDVIWNRLVRELDHIEDVTLIDDGTTREFVVSSTFRVRVKRHQIGGDVSSYPTQTALEFFTQENGQLAFEGLEEIRLTAGYEWERDAREIGPAVLSLRDGQSNLIWLVELDEPEAPRGSVTPMPSSSPEPPEVGIELEAPEDAQTEDGFD